MKNILVIGATGQIGSELTLELRKRYGDDHVVAGYIPSAMPKGELKASGPSAIADVTDRQSIEVVARQFKIDTIYNLAALLSVVAESRPAMAWKIGIDGLWNVLEVAREYNCAVFTPSSIGSFGEATPHVKTPQDTIQRPRTMYGVCSGSKLMEAMLKALRCFSLAGAASISEMAAFSASGIYIISIYVPAFTGHTNFSPFTAE